MTGNPIIRTPTAEETRDFIPIDLPKGAVKTPRDRFMEELGNEAQKANKKGLPFASKPALDEWEDYWANEVKRLMREFGYVKEEAVKPKKMEWAKYSDLNNFDLVKEGEIRDAYLSKKKNEEVFLKFRTYKFKGYINKYQIMEPYQGAWSKEKK